MKNKITEFFRKKPVILWHSESPGVKIIVRRSKFGSLYKSPYFATLSECLAEHKRRRIDKEMKDAYIKNFYNDPDNHKKLS